MIVRKCEHCDVVMEWIADDSGGGWWCEDCGTYIPTNYTDELKSLVELLNTLRDALKIYPFLSCTQLYQKLVEMEHLTLHNKELMKKWRIMQTYLKNGHKSEWVGVARRVEKIIVESIEHPNKSSPRENIRYVLDVWNHLSSDALLRIIDNCKDDIDKKTYKKIRSHLKSGHKSLVREIVVKLYQQLEK